MSWRSNGSDAGTGLGVGIYNRGGVRHPLDGIGRRGRVIAWVDIRDHDVPVAINGTFFRDPFTTYQPLCCNMTQT